MLPCKPDSASRDVTFMGTSVQLEVLGCETGGATFALLQAGIGDGARAGEALAQWRAASLANMRAATGRDTPFVPAGALRLPQSLSVAAAGHRADGTPVESQAAYFASGTRVYQAIVFAEKLRPEITEPFFAGLQLR